MLLFIIFFLLKSTHQQWNPEGESFCRDLGGTVYENGTYCLKFFPDESLDWGRSRLFCKDVFHPASDLLVISTDETQKLVENMLRNSDESTGFWFGLNSIINDQNWVFIDTTSLSVSFWDTNQPDNLGDYPYCAVLFANSYPSWRFHDYSCFGKIPFVCSFILSDFNLTKSSNPYINLEYDVIDRVSYCNFEKFNCPYFHEFCGGRHYADEGVCNGIGICRPGNTNYSTPYCECKRKNFDFSKNCQQCLFNLDFKSNCTDCKNNSVLLNNHCQCQKNYVLDYYGECSYCINGFSLESQCTECRNHYDLEFECTTCKNKFDIATDCTACFQNYLYESHCSFCINQYTLESGCTECYGNYSIFSSCVLCINNYDVDTFCTGCLYYYDDKTNCTTCKNGFDINSDCQECPYTHNVIEINGELYCDNGRYAWWGVGFPILFAILSSFCVIIGIILTILICVTCFLCRLVDKEYIKNCRRFVGEVDELLNREVVIVNSFTGRALDIENRNGAILIEWKPNCKRSQKFKFIKENEFYYIQNVNSGQFLTYNKRTWEKEIWSRNYWIIIQLNRKQGNNKGNNKWNIINNQNGTFSFQNMQSSLFISFIQFVCYYPMICHHRFCRGKYRIYYEPTKNEKEELLQELKETKGKKEEKVEVEIKTEKVEIIEEIKIDPIKTKKKKEKKKRKKKKKKKKKKQIDIELSMEPKVPEMDVTPILYRNDITNEQKVNEEKKEVPEMEVPQIDEITTVVNEEKKEEEE